MTTDHVGIARVCISHSMTVLILLSKIVITTFDVNGSYATLDAIKGVLFKELCAFLVVLFGSFIQPAKKTLYSTVVREDLITGFIGCIGLT